MTTFDTTRGIYNDFRTREQTSLIFLRTNSFEPFHQRTKGVYHIGVDWNGYFVLNCEGQDR